MGNRIDLVGKAVSELKQDFKFVKDNVAATDLWVTRMEETFKAVQEDMMCFDDDLEDVQTFVENLENSLKKNNMKLRGLKVQIEGDNLAQYLQDLFMSCVDPECAYHLGQYNSRAKYPKDIIIKFFDWQSFSGIIQTSKMKVQKTF